MSRIQLLVAAVQQDTEELPSKMNIQSDAVIVNQCDRDLTEENDYTDRLGKSHVIKTINKAERGVGLSRNLALKNADHELLQFIDEDIVLDDGYTALMENEFDSHPEADMLLFNVKAVEGRQTYHNTDFARVTWKNYGRYPAYAIAARTAALKGINVKFSVLFGGGAKYSNGEDSLFLHDCLKKGLKIYRTGVSIGHEESDRPSTWFTGFNDKFFFDRGVLYHFLYGALAGAMSLRFLLVHRDEMCREKSVWQCYRLMKKGIRQGRLERL
ncbi:Glycosyl transferase family 2 [Butyrivibrio sp. ob235]|uniref:glycosyltransferase family A protein n=1 Tax=unclassified Butyrivibrio TaxID=2639466 RepID=UPI0003B33CCE|nr:MULTISPECIES: glycosyltransferase family A protein [unclassified Butyrivibrio]SEK82425.1 Glycosyl transferase family 2 [Butyrivibrio sp. ob235]